jgi:hypothetical protein
MSLNINPIQNQKHSQPNNNDYALSSTK